MGWGNRNRKEGEAVKEVERGMDRHPDDHTPCSPPVTSGPAVALDSLGGSPSTSWSLSSTTASPAAHTCATGRWGSRHPAKKPPPCQPQTDRQAGRHARQAICLVVFFERSRFPRRCTQGVSRTAPSPPCSRHACRQVGVLLRLKPRGMVPNFCLSGAGYGWISSTTHGNLMPLGYGPAGGKDFRKAQSTGDV